MKFIKLEDDVVVCTCTPRRRRVRARVTRRTASTRRFEQIEVEVEVDGGLVRFGEDELIRWSDLVLERARRVLGQLGWEVYSVSYT